ncbi:hypothetical protein [uncultured Methanocorpusculum sp.]|nr:hypothetical protein [uncultured Methanocorpusculum sp.]
MITDYLYAAWTKDVCLTVDETSLIITSGTSQLITGNATGTTQLLYYIFGTNYFRTDMISVDDDGSYWAYFNTETISTGQYFAVIQHPGADSVFNVGPVAADNWGSYINMNVNGDYTSEDAFLLFDTQTRQSANAAEALCCALDSQNIDDEYANIRVIVTQQMISMNSVSDVVRGQPLNISGTTNFQPGTIVTVEVSSITSPVVDKNNMTYSPYPTPPHLQPSLQVKMV